MKKVSTAAATESRNISQPKLTIGLDLGDRHSWYCVLNEAGQIQLEQRVRTNATALWLAPGPDAAARPGGAVVADRGLIDAQRGSGAPAAHHSPSG